MLQSGLESKQDDKEKIHKPEGLKRYERVLAPSLGLFLLGMSVLASYNILNFPETQMKI